MQGAGNHARRYHEKEGFQGAKAEGIDDDRLERGDGAVGNHRQEGSEEHEPELEIEKELKDLVFFLKCVFRTPELLLRRRDTAIKRWRSLYPLA